MNTSILPIRQLLKVDKDIWSYLRVLRGKIRRIAMSASLQEDETAAYEVSHRGHPQDAPKIRNFSNINAVLILGL